jgi:restriction endonuclease Mrr
VTEHCNNCKAPWKPTADGVCSFCGNRGRDISIVVHDSIHITDSTEVKIIPNIEFDLSVPYEGKTIIDVAKVVDEKLVAYFLGHPDELKTMNRRLFEKLVAELFHGFGYEVELTKQTRDGGKDIIAIRQDEIKVKYLIECKRPDPGGYVNVRTVRELYGVKSSEGATKGIIVTTAYFSKDAKDFFDKHKWELEGKQYEDLRQWLEKYLQTRNRKFA